MRFEEFSSSVQEAGLEARHCAAYHWQIRGGQRLVNVWANTKRGFRYQVAGERGRSGSLDGAIKAAGPLTREPPRESELAGLKYIIPPWEEIPDGTMIAVQPKSNRVGLIRWLWRLLW